MKTLRFTMETAAVLVGVSPAIRALAEDVELAARIGCDRAHRR